MEAIINSYYNNNAQKLHKMIDKIIFRLKFNVDNEDFYSLGNEIFIDVINRYDGKQQFDGFLKSVVYPTYVKNMTESEVKENKEYREFLGRILSTIKIKEVYYRSVIKPAEQ